MSRQLLLILLAQIIPLSCSAFIGGISNRRQQAQPLTTTLNGCDNIRCRSLDQHGFQQQKKTNAYVQLPTFKSRGIGARRIASTTTTSTTTQLLLHPTTGASLAIVGSSLFGMQISRLVPSGGILGTLISAAVFGNIFTKWIPNKHPLYDLCFKLFLPSSLTLLLLAYRPPRNDFDPSNQSAITLVTATDD